VIVEKIASFLRAPAAEAFEALAIEAFRFQWERIEALRRLTAASGLTPEQIRHWEQIPLVPTALFSEAVLATDTPREIFRSSGTLGGEPSVHHHPYPELYRLAIDLSFPRPSLPKQTDPDGRVPMLSLIPSRATAPHSSLAFMIEHVLTRFGAADSLVGWGPGGLEGKRVRSFLAARQRDRRPVLLLTTTLALAELLDFLEKLRLRFRLPPASVLWETGGPKGRAREIQREALVERAWAVLGLPAEFRVEEYGMAELTSQAYTETLLGGPPGSFRFPPWVRVRALDPITHEPLPPGKTGVLAIFDLANVGSALHVLTEDLGAISEDGRFALQGRAPDAPLRGCSLLAESRS
jgi:hypothetical protein